MLVVVSVVKELRGCKKGGEGGEWGELAGREIY